MATGVVGSTKRIASMNIALSRRIQNRKTLSLKYKGAFENTPLASSAFALMEIKAVIWLQFFSPKKPQMPKNWCFTHLPIKKTFQPAIRWEWVISTCHSLCERKKPSGVDFFSRSTMNWWIDEWRGKVYFSIDQFLSVIICPIFAQSA